MNEIQKHLIKLLREIDEICTKSGIPYLLCGRTAKDACQSHHFLGDYVFATVLMRGQDFDKFRSLVAKKEGRSVESLRENPDFPDGMAMRYVDDTTTFIYGHTAHNYRHKGIYITIQKCRVIPKNKYKARLANVIDHAINYMSIDDVSGFSKKKWFGVKCLQLVVKLLGKSGVINIMMDFQDKLTRSGGKNLAYVRPFRKNVKIPASMFVELQRMELEGELFWVPADIDTYLERVYGSNWLEDNKPETIATKHLLVCSTRISYKEVDNDDSLYANRAEVNAIIKKRKKLAAQIKPLRAKIEKYWDILFLTKERYRLYRKYMPVADILKERLSKRDYAWLSIAMQDYLDTVKTYLSKNLPVTICPVLDDVVLNVMYYTGEISQVQKFKKLKSKLPLKSIAIELDECTKQEALMSLPATISYDEDNGIMVCLHHGEKLHAVAFLDEHGKTHPLLLKQEREIVSASANVSVTGESCCSSWQLAIQDESGAYIPIFDSEWCMRLFNSNRAIPLVQHIYGQDLELAWLDGSGRVYVAAQFDDCDMYKKVSIPEYLFVRENMEVPVGYFDVESGSVREVFCLDDKGSLSAVVTLGVGGSLWVAPGAAQKLYYRDDDERFVQLTTSRFADQMTESVRQVLCGEKEPKLCCTLVQKDAFGRIIEIASLYDDESIYPLVRVNADGSLSKLEQWKRSYATLCLKQCDGTDISLAEVDSEGNIISSSRMGERLSLQAVINQMKI